LLYLASKHQLNQLVESAMTTSSHLMDWACAEAKKYGMAMYGGSSMAKELNCGVTNIGSALHQWTKVMHKRNELDAKKDEKDTKKKVEQKN
jgi:hypothetical protein